jgi:hypothetical protein
MTMNYEWKLITGVSPVGSEVETWDYVETADDYRERYYFNVIPDESVTELYRIEGTNDIQFTLLGLEAMGKDPETVVSFTISIPGGHSFLALGWMRAADAHAQIVSWLEAVK